MHEARRSHGQAYQSPSITINHRQSSHGGLLGFFEFWSTSARPSANQVPLVYVYVHILNETKAHIHTKLERRALPGNTPIVPGCSMDDVVQPTLAGNRCASVSAFAMRTHISPGSLSCCSKATGRKGERLADHPTVCRFWPPTCCEKREMRMHPRSHGLQCCLSFLCMLPKYQPSGSRHISAEILRPFCRIAHSFLYYLRTMQYPPT